MRALRISSMLALAAGALSGLPAAAENSRFQRETIRVYPAADLIVEPNGTQFAFGHDLSLTVKPQARAQAAAGMEVRIFRLEPNGALRAWARYDPCDVYLSSLYPDVRASRDVIDFGKIQTLDWLTVEANKAPSAGHFLIVFESRTAGGPVVRNEPDVIARYLRDGLRVEIDPPAGPYDQGKVNTEATARAGRIDALSAQIHANTAAYPCYHLDSRLGVASGNSIVSCEVEPASTAAAAGAIAPPG